MKMQLKHRFFAFALLLVMVFNIFKYQIPQIQYSLFRDYIANNLCVNKNKKNSCCQGKCFIVKQTKVIDESSSETNNTGNNSNNKKNQNYEIKEFLSPNAFTCNTIETYISHYVNTENRTLPGFVSTIFAPPKYLLPNT